LVLGLVLTIVHIIYEARFSKEVENENLEKGEVSGVFRYLRKTHRLRAECLNQVELFERARKLPHALEQFKPRTRSTNPRFFPSTFVGFMFGFCQLVEHCRCHGEVSAETRGRQAQDVRDAVTFEDGRFARSW